MGDVTARGDGGLVSMSVGKDGGALATAPSREQHQRVGSGAYLRATEIERSRRATSSRARATRGILARRFGAPPKTHAVLSKLARA